MAEDRINKKYRLLVIGGSAGSLEVVLQLVPRLREGLSLAIVIVLHRKTDTGTVLIGLLASKTSMAVKEAEDKEAVLPGIIYVAPADYHLLVEKDHTFSLDYSEKVNYSRPSIDVTFETAAEAYGASLACLLLSGANADGTEGMKRIKDCGGYTLVQHPDTAEMPYMPRQAIEALAVDRVLQPSQMADVINTLSA